MCLTAKYCELKNIKMSEFEAILLLKVEGIVEQLLEERKMSLQDLLEYFYSSHLNKLLEREEIKILYYNSQNSTI